MLLVLTILPSGTVLAQQSTLQQQLLEPDCTRPGGCEMHPPTIDEINKNGNRPIIKGTFDSAFSRYLRVIFGGKIYTLNNDSELTVSGTKWELSLSGLSKPLALGAYDLVVETEGYDGETKRISTIVLLTPKGSTGTGVTDPDDSSNAPRPLSPVEARRRISLEPLLLTLISSIALFLLVAFLKRLRDQD